MSLPYFPRHRNCRILVEPIYRRSARHAQPRGVGTGTSCGIKHIVGMFKSAKVHLHGSTTTAAPVGGTPGRESPATTAGRASSEVPDPATGVSHLVARRRPRSAGKMTNSPSRGAPTPESNEHRPRRVPLCAPSAVMTGVVLARRSGAAEVCGKADSVRWVQRLR